jgi:hypothetical protein
MSLTQTPENNFDFEGIHFSNGPTSKTVCNKRSIKILFQILFHIKCLLILICISLDNRTSFRNEFSRAIRTISSINCSSKQSSCIY